MYTVSTAVTRSNVYCAIFFLCKFEQGICSVRCGCSFILSLFDCLVRGIDVLPHLIAQGLHITQFCLVIRFMLALFVPKLSDYRCFLYDDLIAVLKSGDELGSYVGECCIQCGSINTLVHHNLAFQMSVHHAKPAI